MDVGFGRSQALPVGTPLEGVFVQLTKDGQRKLQTTDKHGRFEFDDLRPGIWHLKVYDQNLPAGYLLPAPEMDVEVVPGDKKELVVLAVPRIRRIRMQQPATVTQ